MNTLKRLESLFFALPLSGAPKLSRMCAMLDLLGNPHRNFPIIHIAGTNGKGSVTWKIAKALELAQYKTGRFISPHIDVVYERIAINSINISKENFVKYLTHIFEISDTHNICCTFFEYITLVMFCYFKDCSIDFAVIETGLGGRYDATNVADSILAIITSISLDHTHLLGGCIEDITREKAGIIKSCTDVVIGPCVPLSIVLEHIDKNKQNIYQVHGNFEHFELENRAIARQSLLTLQKKIKINLENIEEGICSTPPCRYEHIDQAVLIKKFLQAPPAVILDAAHNPDGFKNLFKKVSADFKQKPVIALGISSDKDIEQIVAILVQYIESIFILDNFSHRACPSSTIVHYLEQYKIEQNKVQQCKMHNLHVITGSKIDEILMKAYLHTVALKSPLIICGSFYIMADAKRFFID